MNFDAYGRIKFYGCAATNYVLFYDYKFVAGDIAYVKSKALKGRLEKIAIKKPIVHKDSSTFNQIVILYQDTFNAMHEEDQIVDYSTALALVQAYTLYLEERASREAGKYC